MCAKACQVAKESRSKIQIYEVDLQSTGVWRDIDCQRAKGGQTAFNGWVHWILPDRLMGVGRSATCSFSDSLW